ncbi:MAG: spore maturation protein, partial [Verrucomicrobia bacterium]|nr:spore maturation protein [Verrucomicrobiota bacterium]
ARVAVMDIALPLAGLMALWLGMMRLVERAGLIRSVARLLRPVLCRLFPDVPPDHPAMGSMVMNLSANMLGLNNAATPLGLRAMRDLEQLNRARGTATDAMCTFLALNTSSVQLIPATAVAVLAAAGSKAPTAIVGTALAATAVSTAVGIVSVKLLEKTPWFRLSAPRGSRETFSEEPSGEETPSKGASEPRERASRGWRRALPWALAAGFLALLVRQTAAGIHGGAPPGMAAVQAVSALAIPFLLAFLPLYAAVRGLPVYEEFVEGAKEGFQVSLRIIPYLVAMLVAIRIFRAGGGVEWLSRMLGPALAAIGFPADLLPMALTRPLSGSAAIGLFSDLATRLGPDHLVTRMGGTLLGSTETTLYVAAIYFGAVGVKRVRHAVLAGLLADLAGILASVWICRAMWG